MNSIKKNKAVSLWLFTGCLMIFMMILIGGVTRLTGSGLSIVEWNVVAGAIPPLDEKEWNVAFEKYKQFPQYKKLNSDMDLSGFKNIFFWEYVHRLWGRVIGLVFIFPFLWFYFTGKIQGRLLRRLLLILVLGALQGALGWFMVKSGLVDNPNVSHYRLAAHLALALVVLSVVLVTALQTSPYVTCIESEDHVPFKSVRPILLFLVFLQIIFGAFVAGMKAGFSYNTFPKMGSEWIPQGIVSLKPIYLNFLENGSALQFIHRFIGILLLSLVVLVWSLSIIRKKEDSMFTILLLVVGIQVGLGICTLLLNVPVFLAVAHQGVGIILFPVALIMNYNFKPNSNFSN